MECSNIHCTEKDPQFYKGRKLCKKCHNKRVIANQKKKREKDKITMDSLNQKLDTVLHKLDELCV
jgi:hypothetical protein